MGDKRKISATVKPHDPNTDISGEAGAGRASVKTLRLQTNESAFFSSHTEHFSPLDLQLRFPSPHIPRNILSLLFCLPKTQVLNFESFLIGN